ncbi:MAG: homoserine dehydrogenase [Acidobacteriota bacterium]|jgi:homoserine dehydrogenase|nr:homoserine dehydrogenase [Acidobacteriota bacterium]
MNGLGEQEGRAGGPLRLLLLGFGNVGRRLAEILADRASYPGLAGLDVSVVGITTGSRGAAVNPAGLDLGRALAEISERGRFGDGYRNAATLTSEEALRVLDYDVAVELTPLDIRGRGAAAIAHVRTAMERGRHAITCNKGPLAWGWRPLRDLARERGVCFLYETTVLDGVPVFNLAQGSLRGNTILKIEGILNSTTNFVLCEMERGLSLSAAVAGAQRLGVAETDPADDLDGWDAAVKVSALANVLFDAELSPEAVERQSLASIRIEHVEDALAREHRLKMVCEAFREGEQVIGRVRLREIPLTDPFALVEGTGSILRLTTDILGCLVLTEEDPDLSSTAYGVISDLFRLQDETGW